MQTACIQQKQICAENTNILTSNFLDEIKNNIN